MMLYFQDYYNVNISDGVNKEEAGTLSYKILKLSKF